MGLKWSAPKMVKKNTLLVLDTPFPTDNSKDQFWNMWKVQKTQIRADGFGMAKDKGSWKINYFHTITDDSLQRATNGKFIWQIEFEQKIKKWADNLNKVTEMMKQKVDINDIDAVTQDE